MFHYSQISIARSEDENDYYGSLEDDQYFASYEPKCKEDEQGQISSKIKNSLTEFVDLNREIETLSLRESQCTDLYCELKEYAEAMREIGMVMKKQILILTDVAKLLLACGSDTVMGMLRWG